jgi:penicillin amidase
MRFDPAEITAGAAALQKAKTFDEFRRAVTRFGALDANWIYSDRAGNIGYQLGAPVPVRNYDTYVRQKADDPNTLWRGFRALDETPHALNPQQGYLASCNNQIVSAKWPDPIPGFYDPYRIARANALLPMKRTPADMHAMQHDLVSGLALRWKDLATAGMGKAHLDEHLSDFLDHGGWKGDMSADSRAAAIFAAWWRRLPKAVFEDELGSDWESGRFLLEQALTTGIAIDDVRTKEVETLVDISARAMREAVVIADDRTWGEACKQVIEHPLARVRVLDWFLDLNRGPFPGRGDGGALNANFYSYDDESKSFRTRLGPSMRFVLDWSDVDAFTLTGALGQSGNPFSPHYDDFLPMMRGGEAWNVPFAREKVYARKTSLLRLTP